MAAAGLGAEASESTGDGPSCGGAALGSRGPQIDGDPAFDGTQPGAPLRAVTVFGGEERITLGLFDFRDFSGGPVEQQRDPAGVLHDPFRFVQHLS